MIPQVACPDDTRIVTTRRFAAPPALMFRARTGPDLIQHWKVGSDGRTMPTCQSDPRLGGSFRLDGFDDKSTRVQATGEYLKVTPPGIVYIERMFLPDPNPRHPCRDPLPPDGNGTRLTVTMTLPRQAARDSVTRHRVTGHRHDRGAEGQLCPPRNHPRKHLT